MHTRRPDLWQHPHDFGMDRVQPGERRTLIVALLTAVFMVAEIAGGMLFGSMALLADGMHMGSHAMALGIAVAAYVYARKRARDPRFCFGVGKVNALAGFTGALLLAVFAVAMAAESVERLVNPTEIAFDAAIIVAVLGLLVNLVSVVLLGAHGHSHDEDEEDHVHTAAAHGEVGPEKHAGPCRPHHHDHNLRSAYLHVMADALTSVTAIVALLGGKYMGWEFLDPVMGIAGSLLVARWSWGLLRQTSRVLLDHQAPEQVLDRVRASLEQDSDDRVVDLHIWSIGPGVRAACLSVVTDEPAPPHTYKDRLPTDLNIQHVTVEVHPCDGHGPAWR